MSNVLTALSPCPCSSFGNIECSPRSPGGFWQPGDCDIHVPLLKPAELGLLRELSSPTELSHLKESIPSLIDCTEGGCDKHSPTGRAAAAEWGRVCCHSSSVGSQRSSQPWPRDLPSQKAQQGMCCWEPWVKQHSKAPAEGSGGNRARVNRVPGLESSPSHLLQENIPSGWTNWAFTAALVCNSSEEATV